jgi:putative flippase GtrA
MLQVAITRLAPHEEKLRFLVVGVWNVIFSMLSLLVLERLIPYGPGSALAASIGGVGAKQVVLVVNWVISVSQNMVTFKLLVFRTKGHWLREYARMYVTYTGTFIVESVMVQVISAVAGWSLFWARVPALVVVTVLSYFGNKYFTFRTTEDRIAEDLEAGPEVTSEAPEASSPAEM